MLVDPSNRNYFIKKNTIRCNGVLIDLSTPLVMGILNVTPDSFFDGGQYNSIEDAVLHAGDMLKAGASVIDIGACSTRPGADVVSLDQELKRLEPVVRQIRRQFPDAVLSIDTSRSEVARRIVGEYGDCIINDISGGHFDRDMFKTIASLHVPYVLMHMVGTPQTMQVNPQYGNVTKEVMLQLSEGVYKLHELGVSDVIIDPGFGFGKSLDHNFELFNHLDAFRFFELPLLVGISRKSMMYRLLNKKAEDSLNATTALNTLALQAGADILRVHDVDAAVEAVTLFEKIKQFAQ
jgi:dihydropteroate synthase